MNYPDNASWHWTQRTEIPLHIKYVEPPKEKEIWVKTKAPPTPEHPGGGILHKKIKVPTKVPDEAEEKSNTFTFDDEEQAKEEGRRPRIMNGEVMIYGDETTNPELVEARNRGDVATLIAAEKARKAYAETTAAEHNKDIQEKSPTKEKNGAEKKKTVSFYVTEKNYRKLQSLARFRAATGERNSRGQALSTGSLINTAIEEYLERHSDELEQFEHLSQMLQSDKK